MKFAAPASMQTPEASDLGFGMQGLRTSRDVELFRAERTRKDLVLRTALLKKRASPKQRNLRRQGRAP